jgi:hypothetical protein
MGSIEDVTPQRRKRGDITRDVIAEMGGGGFPRMRAKAIYTPYEARMRLLEELRDTPKRFRERSIRRRLTALDRALSDDEARAFDRAFNAWLVLNGKSKSVNPMSVGGGNSQSDPLNERELQEATAYRIMFGKIGFGMRMHMRCLFEEMAPWSDKEPIYETDMICQIVRAIKKAYEEQR